MKKAIEVKLFESDDTPQNILDVLQVNCFTDREEFKAEVPDSEPGVYKVTIEKVSD